jgi:bifunctional non-homologous end joining protein LigD
MKIQHEYRSRTNPSGKPHITTYDTDARTVTACTCRGWRSPNRCWHVPDVLAQHAQDEPALTVNGLTPFDEEARVARATRVQAPAVPPRQHEPMLASAMTKGQRIEQYMTEAWWMEVKYDGIRWIGTVLDGQVMESRSRSGKTEIALPPHILALLKSLPNGTYDGEIIVPGGKSTDVTVKNHARWVLVLFDVLALLGQPTVGVPYTERRALLTLAAGHVAAQHSDCTRVALAASSSVSPEGIAAILDSGGEGVVLKRAASVYQPGVRSPDWVKVKRSGAVTCTIVRFGPGDTGDTHGRTFVRTDDGMEFKVKTQRSILGSDLPATIGRRVVVQYVERLASGKFRHPALDHLAGAGE